MKTAGHSAGSFVIPPLTLPFSAELTMPGSKSHANRALILACLCPGETIIRNATPCDDVQLMVKGLQALGYRVEWIDEAAGTIKVVGGIPENPRSVATTLDCGHAGTTVRFLTSLACVTPGSWIITGSERMRQRPIADLVSALRQLGADITDTNGCPPVKITGRRLQGGAVDLAAGTSSQFLTSLLLLGSSLPAGLSVRRSGHQTSATYVELTRRTLQDFGIRTDETGDVVRVQGTLHSPRTYDIEGDWSAAGTWLVLQELTGSELRLPNLRSDSEQGDRLVPDAIAKLRQEGDIAIDCEPFPDQVMNLAMLAASRRGTTRLLGAANLRVKECDRLAVTADGLQRVGIQAQVLPDGLQITGSATLRSATLATAGDHRMAMCFAILGALHKEITIDDATCVAKSYPQFWEHYAVLRQQTVPLAIIGMRGVGKSHFARRLGGKLGLKTIDTDAVFVEHHGPIRDYVAAHDWDAFRTAEADVVRECLRPGCVVALGGGAIETAAVRELLASQALCIWIDITVDAAIARLQKLDRPSLTGLPLDQEVRSVLAKRQPLYESLADIRIPSSLPFPAYVPYTLRMLKRLCSW